MSHLRRIAASLTARSALALLAAAAGAQEPQRPSSPPPIQDNSFLIEEAYNQDAYVVQHIFNFQPGVGASQAFGTFTQEWPAGSITH